MFCRCSSLCFLNSHHLTQVELEGEQKRALRGAQAESSSHPSARAVLALTVWVWHRSSLPSCLWDSPDLCCPFWELSGPFRSAGSSGAAVGLRCGRTRLCWWHRGAARIPAAPALPFVLLPQRRSPGTSGAACGHPGDPSVPPSVCAARSVFPLFQRSLFHTRCQSLPTRSRTRQYI